MKDKTVIVVTAQNVNPLVVAALKKQLHPDAIRAANEQATLAMRVALG